VAGYELGDRGSIAERGGGFFLYPVRPAGSGAHPASCIMGTGGKARPRPDADHSPPSNAEVKKERGLCLLSTQAPLWSVAGQLYFNLIYLYIKQDLHMHILINLTNTVNNNRRVLSELQETRTELFLNSCSKKEAM
jgi:hypothetical protein